MDARSVDHTGVRYGKLTAIEWRGSRQGATRWLVRCDCGVVKEVFIASVVSGKVVSCGCEHRKIVTKHGMEGTRIYNVWASMLQRCRNPNHRAFHNYGGRGITVCKRWEKFENFFADMGLPPPNRSLDRRDNNRGYTPDNCRWATRSEQNRNQRRHMKE